MAETLKKGVIHAEGIDIGIYTTDFKNEAGDNSFVMTPKRWIESTGAIGIVSKQGRYAATYAHRDIAFEFAVRQMETLVMVSMDGLKQLPGGV